MGEPMPCPQASRSRHATRYIDMHSTQQFTDLTSSLLPRSLDPELSKSEGSSEGTDLKSYKLTVADNPELDRASLDNENERNPLLDIVEAGVDAGGDPAVRKMPSEERSTAGTVGPAIK